MNIKQSAAISAILMAVVLTGAGCLGRQSTPAARPTPVPQAEATLPSPSKGEGQGEVSATTPSTIFPANWIRYDKDTAGQIGMSFFYPPELAPVPWDTEAWKPGEVGVDFGGFGIARIPNVERLTIEQWLAKNYPNHAFLFYPVDTENPFYPVLTDGTCAAYQIMDDFDEGAGLSGIGGTVFVDVGDKTLYAFTLAQDWNQELGEREDVIRTAMKSIEWFAEQTSCPKTMTFRDDRVRIAFDYSTELGPVSTMDEYGWGMEEDETVANYTCLEQRALRLEGTSFLIVNDTWMCETLGRGGYWGDQARTFSTEDDVKKWCESKDTCTPYVNAKGVTIYHAYTKSVDVFGEMYSDIDEYGAWNPSKDISGILVSNQGFVQAGLGRMQEEIKAVADSLSFY